MEVPRGVLSMLPPAPRGLQATSRQSFPGGGAGLATSKLPLHNIDDEMQDGPKFLPMISNNGRNSMPGGYGMHGMHKSPLSQDPSSGPASRLGRDGNNVFAPNSKAQAPMPEKAFPEREDFKSPWSLTADPTKSPPWMSQVLSRLDALENSRGPSSTAADPNLASRLKALEDSLSQMQQTEMSLQQHDKLLLKKLALLEQQVAAVEQKLKGGGAAGGEAAAAGEHKHKAGAPYNKGGAKAEAAAATTDGKDSKVSARELAEIKSSLAQLAEHDSSLRDHQKQLQAMTAAVSKLQASSGAGGKGKRQSDAGGDAGKGAGVMEERVVSLEARVQLQEAAAAAAAKAVADASSAAAAALEAANTAQVTSAASAASAAAAAQVIPDEVRQAITAVVGPLMQDTAAQLAVLTVRVTDGEQQTERVDAQCRELQASIGRLQQQAAEAAAGAAAAAGGQQQAAAAAAPAPAPAPAEGAGAAAAGVQAKILLAIGAKVDKLSDQQSKLAKQVDALAQQGGGSDGGAVAPAGKGTAAAAAPSSASSSEDARAAQQTANQALAASSRALTQASQALSQANGFGEELKQLQAAAGQQHERLGKVEELSNQAAGFASMAHQNVAGLEQVAKTLMVKVDTLTMEMVGMQAKQNSMAAMTSGPSAQAAAAAAAQFQDGAPGADPRVPAILLDLRQLATGLGELAGRISVAERETAMTMPTLARVQALKDLENTLLDKQQQVLQEVEVMKRGMQAAQAQSWQQQAAMAGAVHSPVSPLGMGYMPPGMQTGMQHGMQNGMQAMGQGAGMADTQGRGAAGRSFAKSNSVVLRRSESKRVPSTSAIRI